MPWQLRLFRKTLKKRQKLHLLLDLLGPLQERRCLLVTKGDNNGALNWHFRAAGGRWTWAELEPEAAPGIAALLGEPVEVVAADRLPFPEGAFERVTVIDVHEHLEEPEPLNREVARVLTPGGIAVLTTPNGDPRLPLAVLKRWVGMGPAAYGHVVQGFTTEELEAMTRAAGLVPEARGAYARFFTEAAELVINLAYVKLLARRGRGARVPEGTIAPQTGEQLQAVSRSVRAYELVYPLVRAFSALDALVPGRGGYAVAVRARKPA